MNNNNSRRKVRLRLLVVVDLLLVVVALAVLIVWTPQPSAAQATFVIHKTDQAAFDPPSRGEPFFVLLIGNDGRPGLDGIRGDGLHLVGINPAAGSATILNIPRDTYVPIPGLGSNKINDAYKQGGFAKQVETVAAYSGVNPSFVIETNFVGFESLVNEIGGLHVEVPYAMFDRNSGADFHAGRNHMLGAGALAFARNRNIPNGDIARTTHQGLLLIAGLERVREAPATPFETLRLLGMIARHTRYEGVSLREIHGLIRLGLSIDPANVRNVTMPSVIGKVGQAEVVFPGPGTQEVFADFRDDAILQSH